jgi:hypothetical protein
LGRFPSTPQGFFYTDALGQTFEHFYFSLQAALADRLVTSGARRVPQKMSRTRQIEKEAARVSRQ